jgi:hypothetical protein
MQTVRRQLYVKQPTTCIDPQNGVRHVPNQLLPIVIYFCQLLSTSSDAAVAAFPDPACKVLMIILIIVKPKTT